jgi:hypothetical protein
MKSFRRLGREHAGRATTAAPADEIKLPGYIAVSGQFEFDDEA